MDEEYDVVILGTGLKECILSGIFSKEGKKVLHMDRNDYYGGACASLSPLDKVYSHFEDAEGKAPESMGKGRDFSIDLIPKFLMGNGQLVKALVHTDVTRYLEFKVVEGSYVYRHPGIVKKIPATSSEALTTPLVGMMQKNKLRAFLKYIFNFNKQDEKTWNSWTKSLTLESTAEDLYKYWQLDQNTQDFVGHAAALYTNDKYLARPMIELIDRLKLYYESMARYGQGASPFLYPLYGLGELPQGFARLSAIYGGTYMLDRPIEGFEFGEDGKIVAVKAKDPDSESGEVKDIKTKMVIGDPSYFDGMVKKVGQIVRAICILDHPIPETNGNSSCQIIIPARQSGTTRKSDIYILCVSKAHNVAADGKYLAICSTTVETEEPEKELALAFQLIGAITKKFVSVSDMFAPNDSGAESNCFISRSYDATTHFESTFRDIASIYKRATGKTLDLSQTSTDVPQG